MFTVSADTVNVILRDYGIGGRCTSVVELRRYHYEKNDPASKEVRLIVRVGTDSGRELVIRFRNEKGVTPGLVNDQSRFAALLAENDTENGRFTIGGLEVSRPEFPAKTTPLDSLESWETGVIRDGVFYADQSFRRSFRYPELQQSLKTEQAVEAVMTTDAAGIRRAYSTK